MHELNTPHTRAPMIILLWLTLGLAPGVAPRAAEIADDQELLRARLEEISFQSTRPVGGLQIVAPQVLQAFYQARGFAVAWDDRRAVALTQLIRDAPSHGLDSADYYVDRLASLGSLSALVPEERVAAPPQGRWAATSARRRSATPPETPHA